MNETNNAINRTYENNSRSIEIRLDTSKLLSDIECFLRGVRMVPQLDESGREKWASIVYGRPKCNDIGIQTILSWISIMNPAIVQGNFIYDEKSKVSPEYDNYICDFQIALTTMIITNMYNWEINDENAENIIDFIMLLIRPFFTRLIDNKERESYGDTFRSVEKNSIEDKGFQLFKSNT